MLSIGMIASFLTSNLTVGFILGALFNAPLALAQYADVVVSDVDVSQAIGRWSMAAQFEDFGRGVISLSSVTFFAMLIAVGIYLSVVLIGRRHWMGGKDGNSMLGHYLLRTAALIVDRRRCDQAVHRSRHHSLRRHQQADQLAFTRHP